MLLFLENTWKSFKDIFRNRKLEEYRKRIQEQAKEILQLDKEIIAKNEEIYTVEQALNIQWESIEDMQTKLQEAQAKLVHSEKMASLGILIAGIAHEINNPLNFINTGFMGIKENISDLLNLLEKYRELNAENYEEKIIKIKTLEKEIDYDTTVKIIQDMLSNIDIGVERTKKIVYGLLTFARSNEKDLSVFNIHQNIENTLLILQNKYKGRILIERKYGSIPLIEGYSGRISQVFMNIISNAIDAIKKEGIITIKTEYSEKDRNIKISIKDTGIGISNNINFKIFEPFFTTKQTGEGVGLGLSIAYNIIKEHKGEISVNKHNSKGAEFIITLPLKQ